jgi:hypothetical protein
MQVWLWEARSALATFPDLAEDDVGLPFRSNVRGVEAMMFQCLELWDGHRVMMPAHHRCEVREFRVPHRDRELQEIEVPSLAQPCRF